jgi:mannitol/fructose-specific phosphotransferase system IIA component (Ntr-type)
MTRAYLPAGKDTNISEVIHKAIDRTFYVGYGDGANIAHPRAKRQGGLTKKGTRRVARGSKGITTRELAGILNAKYGFLTTPASNENNKDLANVINYLIQHLNHKGTIQRVYNGVKAMIINPINRGEYGHNEQKTIERKGFDKPLVDTGTLLKRLQVWEEKQLGGV